MKFDQLTAVLLSKLLLIAPFAALFVIDVMPPISTHIGVFIGSLLIGLTFFVGIIPLATIGYMCYLDKIVDEISTPNSEEYT